MAPYRSWDIRKLGVPNILSVVRLILIPVFAAVYFSHNKYSGIISAIILILSGVTDVLDGVIARKYNMTTALGRLLDPLADKLTQAAVCICLVIKGVAPFLLLVLFILKEFAMIAAGARMIKKGKVIMSSKWFGKLATVVFYIAMITIIAIDPGYVVTCTLIGIALLFMLFAFIMYIPFFLNIMKNNTSH